MTFISKASCFIRVLVPLPAPNRAIDENRNHIKKNIGYLAHSIFPIFFLKENLLLYYSIQLTEQLINLKIYLYFTLFNNLKQS